MINVRSISFTLLFYVHLHHMLLVRLSALSLVNLHFGLPVPLRLSGHLSLPGIFAL